MTTALLWIRSLIMPAAHRGNLEERLLDETAARHAAEGRMVDKLANFERRLMVLEEHLASLHRGKGIR